jgi:Zn-dependent protease with chaperone function
MLYVLFLIISLAYNWQKFGKNRKAFLSSLVNAKNSSHREMILNHHFHVFILEVFLAQIVAHLITERAFVIGFLGLGFFYLGLLFFGFFFYRFFVKFLERRTSVPLWAGFQGHMIRELRVNLALVMLPIFTYSLMNMTFQDGVYEDWGSLWFIGVLVNILFVSVVTVVCTVIIMLRLIPNREITEPEYLDLINKKLALINLPNLRVRWIETDIKNAFVVGLKILRFSNQTMFVGKSLRDTLTMEEFDAVVAHELSHVANRHIHQRIIDLIKNFISIVIGVVLIMLVIFGCSILYWGEDIIFHTEFTTTLCFIGCAAWGIFNYALLFDGIRAHEFEADAYAVLKLGANFEALSSALQKLSTPDELPEYLKPRQPKKKKNFFGRHFTTHPELEERMRELKKKIDQNLPFNYYVSSAQKMRITLGHLVQWRIAAPLTSLIFITAVMSFLHIKKGKELVQFVQNSSPESIMKNPELETRINSRPMPLSQSLMFHVVKKEDEKLIDYFIARGADKGRTLIYLSQTKNELLFEKYAKKFVSSISDEEYLLLMRKTAQSDFTEGYRYLVNAQRFEDLSSTHKLDLSRIHQGRTQRAPASTK